MDAPRIALIGGTGFIGSTVAEYLTRQGAQLTVMSRQPGGHAALSVLPGVSVVAADVYDEGSLTRLLAGHDAVVNLVGILHGRRRDFERAHVTLPETLTRAMRAAGVRRLVHVSALGADAHAPSDYQQTKALGERVVEQSGLAWTILRPSVVFGRGDSFLNLFASLCRHLPLLPLSGASTRFAPVWVEDVARAIAACLERPATIGQVLELAGPNSYTLAELVRYVGEVTGHPRTVIPLPAALAMLQASVMECLPGPTLISRDNVRSLQVDNVSLAPFPADLLGFTPSALEAVVPGYLGEDSHAARLNRYRAS